VVRVSGVVIERSQVRLQAVALPGSNSGQVVHARSASFG